ncbi:hypothetical protein [Halocalculus aciditolerans]|uniref:DUF8053 domain-containing protein n=1 Tax=Halocalculus aciditolerans TaxID=1383812 RepID=A0A830FLE3_9EURY|nr:hypothetical protein [Halocalculus aciditolerans]GGL57850.1 hypothetical protein GCM10009039_15030 [Halocalculus aciditolerans]
MAMNKLQSMGGTSFGVVLPMDDLRDEDLVVMNENGGLEAEEVQMRIRRFDTGAWQVLRTDLHDYPAYHEKPAYAQPAKATV